ncbi:endonuclease/exonuclease/phosphatase family protein [Capnocytophaga canimorsus]|uniref:endonuclease/exonuclease/phosphatase family protein n=1 Tax=Capnocytophaga canimorsus TaxID=28188 RepID=UPI00385A5432
MKSLSFFQKIIFIINLGFTLLLLFSYIVPYFFSQKFPELSLFSLLLPFLLLVNIVFFLFWTVQRKKQGFLSLLAIIVGYSHLSRLVQFSKQKPQNKDGFSVMSFNVRLFNHYLWHPNPNLSQQILDFISEKQPDILLIQEFYGNKKYEPSSSIYPYKKIIYKGRKDKIGQAFFSKFPIISSGSLDFPNTANNGSFADVIIQNDTIRLYNLHLESLHLDPEKSKILHENSKELVKNLGKRFALQHQQTQIFKNHYLQSPYKSIVCGDFNNTAFSNIYREIKGDLLKDSFEEAGLGIGKTFHFKYFPFRIDFILPHKTFSVHKHETFNDGLSDHLPVMAVLSLN